MVNISGMMESFKKAWRGEDAKPESAVKNNDFEHSTEGWKLDKNFLHDLEKEICKHCRGKGYSTRFYGTEASDDFGGEGGTVEPLGVHIEYCVCSRGTQLQKVIRLKQLEAQLTVTRTFFKSTKRKRKELIAKKDFLGMFKGYWNVLMANMNQARQTL